jgi:hypothetical protein
MESPLQETKPPGLLRELEEAIRDKNYARAVSIAESIAKPANEVEELQKEAIRQFIVEYRNPQGALALAEEYRFTREDLNQLLTDILKEAEEKKILEKRQFDIKTMRYLTLAEWIKEYL